MADVMHSEEAAALALDPEPSSSAAVLDRRIEFHLARRTYNGFSNNRSFGFKLVTLNPNSEHDKVSELAVKREMPKVSENLGLDPELSLGITFRRIGAGLRNLGNTCFLNSVLQCLTYTEPLAAYLQSGKHQYSCRTAGFCALCAIQKHVSRALQSTGRILEPKDLVSNLRCVSRSFRNARQEDAHEYMVNLLESMHKCCLPSGVPSESHTAYERSLVHKIFGGRLRSQVKCMQCSFCSNKFDPFLDLSLEIAKADSLHKALTHFTAKEFLDGGARQYQCQECKQKVKALKQLTIHNAPHVLTIHLKRFGSHMQGQKIDKKISFSPTLDLKPFVTGPDDEDLSYTLYGVLVHAGWSTHSGHYYCFVRTSSGMWYSLDDNQVVQVNERKVLEQKAYMLFYVRDRKNYSTKKPVAVVQKENKSAMNAIENVVNSNIIQQWKGNIPNDSIEKKSDGFIPVALSERGTHTITSLKEPLKRISFQNVNCSMGVGHVSQRRDAESEPSSSVPPVKDSVDCSAANCNSSGNRAMLGSTCEVSYCNHSLGPKIIGSQKGVTAVQDLIASAMQLPNCNLPKDSVNKKESSEFVAMPPRCYKDTANENHGKSADQPENSSVSVSAGDVCSIAATNLIMFFKHDSTAMPTRTIDEASNKKGYSNFAMQSRIEEAQVQGSPGNVGDRTSLETHGGVQKGTDYQSKFSLHLPATSDRLSNGISNNKVPQLRVKGKLFKCQVSRMSLSSNIIFGVAFAKQKQKRRKSLSLSLQHKNPNLKQLGKIYSPLDLVPSNSDKSLPLPIDYNAYSERERADYCSNDGDKNSSVQNVSCNGNVNDDGCGEKVGQNGAMHATVNQSQLRKATVQVPGNSEKERRAPRQNGIAMTMLEETTVARWDGINVFLPENMKPKSEPSQIGYIGDEWDEEYDRGKRKKIRGPKISFDERNLFQEIATRNAKLKRAKMHPSNSGNQPFRI